MWGLLLLELIALLAIALVVAPIPAHAGLVILPVDELAALTALPLLANVVGLLAGTGCSKTDKGQAENGLH
jgi:hypothetical protein